MCDRCIKQEVCSKYAATGGHMINCVDYIGRSSPRDENGCIAAPRLPMVTDEIAVTLTRQQWETVKAWLIFGKDHHTAKAHQWKINCADPKMAEEEAGKHLASAQAAVAVLERIVAALDWTEQPKEG